MRFALLCLLLFASPAFAAKRVRSYVKPSSGRVVQGHWRTKADGKKWNNWSTKGNTNPYSGKKGTK